MTAPRASRLTLVLSAMAFASVASAAPATQPRDAKGFTQVRIKGALDAKIHQGSGYQVEITAEPDEQAGIKTYVEGDTLVIETPRHDHGWRSHGEVSAEITLPHFQGVAVDGAGNVTVDGVQAQAVSLAIHGAGDLTFAGSAKRVSVELTGAGSVTFAPGHTEALNVALSGAGEVKAKALRAHSASVDLRGTGSVELTADGGSLALGMHGIGSIHWYGTASAVSQSKGGIGTIEHG
jgi:hypothetical protein